MADNSDKLKNRSGYPVKIGNDVICHARALKIRELKRLKELPEGSDDRTMFIMGCAILNVDGTQRNEPIKKAESVQDFIDRITPDLEELDTEAVGAVTDVITKIGRVPGVDALKNS